MTSAQRSPSDTTFIDTTLRVALAIVLIGQATVASTDTDIWGHTAFGLDMLRTWRLTWTDPYSFTSDLHWVNHEWLWDVTTAAAYSTGGVSALLAVRGALIASMVWVVDRASRGLPAWLRMVTLAAVVVACTPQLKSTRPQLASLMFSAVLLSHIDAWWTPVLFVVWANVHGGWLYGLAAMAVFVIVRPTPRAIALLAACGVATLATPYGWQLWMSLGDAVQRGWSDVSEWQPVWRLAAGVDAAVLWSAIVLSVVALRRRVSNDRFAWVWSIVALAAAANSRRLTGLAAISCAVLLVPRWSGARPVVAPSTRPQRWWMVAAAVLASAACVPALRPSLTCFPPLLEWRAPEPDAVAFLRQQAVSRVLPHFDFGEYAIFHLRDRLRVAIDNRRETVYSDAVVQANQRFADGLDPEYPDRIGAEAVWWPATDARVIEQLTDRGWSRRFDGPRTVILMRSAGPVVTGRPSVGTPCFPRP